VASEAQLGSAFALAFIAALVTTPVAIAVARRIAFYDHPEGYKAHSAPIPYLGGAAVIFSFGVAVLVFADGHARFAPLLIGALGLWLVGTIDDRRTVRPVYRLLAAAIAGAFLWATGGGWEFLATDTANLAVTVLWVVGLVNALNLMDNMDGTAGAVAAASAIGVAALALAEGDSGLAAFALPLSGACLGFLKYNLASPARIFLGDGGSMPIGFLLAAATMAMSPEPRLDLRSLILAFLVVGLVIFDTVLVVISRHRRRVPIYKGARDHTTHRLVVTLGSARAVAVTLAVVQAGLCALAVTVAAGEEGYAVFVGAACVAIGFSCGLVLEVGPLALRPTTFPAVAKLADPTQQEPRSAEHGAYAFVVPNGEAASVGAERVRAIARWRR
jgi:UDP-GlcNAc:undecaprenyl-phosphate GlcNAc-1-phosphate transferase